jgi:hypothetical protein
MGKRNFLGGSFLGLKLKDSSSVMCGGKVNSRCTLLTLRATGGIDVLVVI